jgi:hypothetical protein
MKGDFEGYNVSVATGIILYEAIQHRLFQSVKGVFIFIQQRIFF